MNDAASENRKPIRELPEWMVTPEDIAEYQAAADQERAERELLNQEIGDGTGPGVTGVVLHGVFQEDPPWIQKQKLMDADKVIRGVADGDKGLGAASVMLGKVGTTITWLWRTCFIATALFVLFLSIADFAGPKPGDTTGGFAAWAIPVEGASASTWAVLGCRITGIIAILGGLTAHFWSNRVERASARAIREAKLAEAALVTRDDTVGAGR